MELPQTGRLLGAAALGAGLAYYGLRALRRPSEGCLRPVQEIPLAKESTTVEGRIDHICCNPETQTLYVACLGHNCVAVVDAFAGVVRHFLRHDVLRNNRPQGVAFSPVTNRLYVANAIDGKVNVFNRSGERNATEHLGTVDFGKEADNLRFDAASSLVLVGYGDGAIGVIEDHADGFTRRSPERDMCCEAHPESFQLLRGEGEDRTHQLRIFVNVADKRLVQVIDVTSGATVATWPLPVGLAANFPMCVDAASRRVFVGVRKPAADACVLVLDADTGAVIARVACIGDMDDLFYDRERARLYVIGGAGAVSVVGKSRGLPGSGQTWAEIGRVSTSLGARTGFWYAARNALYVAAPAVGNLPARMLVFEAA